MTGVNSLANIAPTKVAIGIQGIFLGLANCEGELQPNEPQQDVLRDARQYRAWVAD
jgi:hypothetical protein